MTSCLRKDDLKTSLDSERTRPFWQLRYLLPSVYCAAALIAVLSAINQHPGASGVLQWGAAALAGTIPVVAALWYILYDFENPFARKRHGDPLAGGRVTAAHDQEST